MRQPVALIGLVMLSITLTGCWSFFGGGYTPPPCTVASLGAPGLSVSSSKAKIGDTIALAATTYPLAYYGSSPCPNVKAVRFYNGELQIGEVTSAPYAFSLTIKPGEKGVPASGPNVDIALFVRAVYDNPDGALGLSSNPAFVRIEYPPVP